MIFGAEQKLGVAARCFSEWSRGDVQLHAAHIEGQMGKSIWETTAEVATSPSRQDRELITGSATADDIIPELL